MTFHAFRLTSGQDLRAGIQAYAARSKLTAAVIVSGVGELKHLQIRLAGAKPGFDPVFDEAGDYEIVSVTGTISHHDLHLHISVARPDGSVLGGHLKAGCIVGVTAEIVLIAESSVLFERQADPGTGYEELVVQNLKHD